MLKKTTAIQFSARVARRVDHLQWAFSAVPGGRPGRGTVIDAALAFACAQTCPPPAPVWESPGAPLNFSTPTGYDHKLEVLFEAGWGWRSPAGAPCATVRSAVESAIDTLCRGLAAGPDLWFAFDLDVGRQPLF